MNKKKLFLWCLYDFANSVVWGNFLLYFTRWIVVEAGLPDLQFNLIFVLSAIIMLMFAPKIAARTDKHGGLIKYLSASTAAMGAFFGAAALFPIFSWNAYGAAIFFLAGFIAYQMSFVFFNPLLNDIADEKHRGRASGWTQFANATGYIFGLVIFAPFAGMKIGALLPAVIVFVLMALPIMLLYREDKKIIRGAENAIEKINLKKLMKLMSVPGVAAALLSFFFFSNADGTMSNNLSIYTKQVFDASENMTIMMVVMVFITIAIGGMVGGFLGDKIGHRKVLIASFAAFGALFPAFALANTFMTACVITAILGLFFGAVHTVSRAYTCSVLPKKDLAYGFSFYTIFERFSSIAGPLMWGLIISLGGSYRLAMGALTIFVAMGLMSMFIKRDNTR